MSRMKAGNQYYIAFASRLALHVSLNDMMPLYGEPLRAVEV